MRKGTARHCRALVGIQYQFTHFQPVAAGNFLTFKKQKSTVSDPVFCRVRDGAFSKMLEILLFSAYMSIE